MRIAYFSPLPPLRSGISDYSAELIPYLAKHAELELFIDEGYEPAGELERVAAIHDYRTFPDLAHGHRYDGCLYQLGNNARYHAYEYQMLTKYPGIVVLHEYLLQDLIRGITLHRGDRIGYLEEMRYCYGATGVYRAHLALDLGVPLDTYAFPLFERVVDVSRGAIVHNEETRRRILRSRPDALVHKVNHHLCLAKLPQVTQDPAGERSALGLPEDAFVVGSFGFVTSPKRQEVALRAFSRFRRAFPKALYVMVGEVVSSAAVGQLMRELDLQGSVVQTGYVDLALFVRYMAVVDIALNLRFPTGGETSGSATRLMGLGKPVIVSNTGSFAEFPDDCCIKIDVDELEEEMILAMMCGMAEDEHLRLQIGGNARRYVEANNSLEDSAQAYIDFLQSTLTPPVEPLFASAPVAMRTEDDVLSTAVMELGGELFDLGLEESHEDVMSELAETIYETGMVPGVL